MRDLPIIMISMSRWDGDYSSAAVSLAKELAKTNKVFYIDYPYTLKDALNLGNQSVRRRLPALFLGKRIYYHPEGYPENFTAVTPMATLPVNWLDKGNLYNTLLSFNDRFIYKVIRKIVEDHKLGKYIFFNSFNPFYSFRLPYPEKVALRVYQTRDDVSAAPYVGKHGPYLERQQTGLADLILATSSELTKKLSGYGKDAIQFSNACDTSIFLEQEINKVPEEISSISEDIIIYTGNICSRIDYDLLVSVAKEHDNKKIVMVGPRHDKGRHNYDLSAFPNIIFTGKKSINELPDYLRNAQCAIIPFKKNKLTRSIYPLKINEYLGTGIPVVSTIFSEDVKEFSDVVYLAEDNEEFNHYINVAIAEDNEEKKDERRKKARRNSWKNRVNSFWQLCEKHTETIPV